MYRIPPFFAVIVSIRVSVQVVEDELIKYHMETIVEVRTHTYMYSSVYRIDTT